MRCHPYETKDQRNKQFCRPKGEFLGASRFTILHANNISSNLPNKHKRYLDGLLMRQQKNYQNSDEFT